jgi:protein-L-isoaspartate(D-aspartate) O-methyltransferase
MRALRRLALLALLVAAPALAQDQGDFAAARSEMVRVIQLEAVATSEATGIKDLDPGVLAVMERVPRHAFVAEPLVPYAYENTPLPIGHDQNMSQPFVIALMSHLLGVKSGQVVFETGTDSGYQAAILAEMGARVYSVEIIEPLAEEAAVRLARLGYDTVSVKAGDGYYGWPENAPYDGILVKEAVDHLPAPLLKQLKPGGRMVIPVGSPEGVQMLTLVEKDAEGIVHRRAVLPVRFSFLQGGSRI